MLKSDAQKVAQISSKLPTGHIQLVVFDVKEMRRLNEDDQRAIVRLQNFIVHLATVHNSLVDSSASLEVKQSAASLECAIDAKIDAMNAMLEKAYAAIAPKRRKATRKKAKLSKTPRAKARRLARATETPRAKAARLKYERALKKAQKELHAQWNRGERRDLKKTKAAQKAVTAAKKLKPAKAKSRRAA